MKIEQVEELRRVMGTLPNQDPQKNYNLVFGLRGIEVRLIDYNINPYKSMYVLGTSCWGEKIDKWADTRPKHRFAVVKAILDGQALPLALECPVFTFTIEGPSRAAFDQYARTRIGAVFSARGMRDNNWKAASFRIPNAILRDPEAFGKVVSLFENVKDVYSDIVDRGKGSWQAARTVLPLYVCYGWSAHYNFAALKALCANRMKFCEMEDTVATAWLMAREVEKRFPLLASYLRPGCDFSGQCQYHKSYSMSEMFGCLFKECGRNECRNSSGYAEFNEVCTRPEDLMVDCGIYIPDPDEWLDYNWGTLPLSDRQLFEAE